MWNLHTQNKLQILSFRRSGPDATIIEYSSTVVVGAKVGSTTSTSSRFRLSGLPFPGQTRPRALLMPNPALTPARLFRHASCRSFRMLYVLTQGVWKDGPEDIPWRPSAQAIPQTLARPEKDSMLGECFTTTAQIRRSCCGSIPAPGDCRWCVGLLACVGSTRHIGLETSESACRGHHLIRHLTRASQRGDVCALHVDVRDTLQQISTWMRSER